MIDVKATAVIVSKEMKLPEVQAKVVPSKSSFVMPDKTERKEGYSVVYTAKASMGKKPEAIHATVIAVGKCKCEPEDEVDHEECKIECAAEEAEAQSAEANTDAENESDGKIASVNNFVKHISQGVSVISNKIRDALHEDDMYNQVKSGLADSKMHADVFYRKTQNAIYHSLCEFMKLDEEGATASLLSNEHFQSTLHAIADIGRNSRYSDEVIKGHHGIIDHCWIDILRDHISKKYDLSEHAMDVLVDNIAKRWCIHNDPESADIGVVDECHCECSDRHCTDVANDEKPNVIDPKLVHVSRVEKSENNICEKVTAKEEENNEAESDEGENDDSPAIDVAIIHDEGVIKIYTVDKTGDVIIPLYVDIENYDIDDYRKSHPYNQNGMWDWLRMFRPIAMFKTSNPDKYIKFNNSVIRDENEMSLKFVILDEMQDKQIVGIYFINDIYGYDQEENRINLFDEVTVELINCIIHLELECATSSYASRALDDPNETFIDESDVDSLFEAYDLNPESIHPGTEESAANETETETVSFDASKPADESLGSLGLAIKEMYAGKSEDNADDGIEVLGAPAKKPVQEKRVEPKVEEKPVAVKADYEVIGAPSNVDEDEESFEPMKTKRKEWK